MLLSATAERSRLALPVDWRRRVRHAVREAVSAVRRRPPVLTLTLVVCIVTIWLRLEVGGQLPTLRFLADGFSPRALGQQDLRVLLTSTLLCRDAFMVASISISLLVTLGSYEVLAGHLRAALMAVVGAVLGPVSVAGGLGLLGVLGSTWAVGRLGTVDIGASAIVAASSGGIAGIVRDRRLTWGLVAFLIGGLLVHHQLADWEHVMVFPWGYLIGRRLGRSRSSLPVPSRRRSAGYALVVACLLLVALPACSRLLPANRVYRSSTGAALTPPRMIDTHYPAPSLREQRRVLVLLPAGYDASHARYPVVVFLHGDPGAPENMFESYGADLLNTITDPKIGPFIGVIPDGHGPKFSDSWYVNIPAQQMGTAVTTDLRRWAGATLRTDGSWSYAGLSSGGYGAAYLPLVDRAPVHAVCGLSGYYNGAHIPLAMHLDAAARKARSPIDHPQRAARLTFLAYGANDPSGIQNAQRYAAVLRRNHHEVVLRSYPGRHQWVVWRPAFRDCLRLVVPAPASH